MENIIKLNKLIKEQEVNKIYYEWQKNITDLTIKWHIGKVLSEVKGDKHAIKKYKDKLKTTSYAYSYSYLYYYRKYFTSYKCPMNYYMGISFHHIRRLLQVKDENEKMYYFDLITKKGLSAKELNDLLKEDIKVLPKEKENNKDNVIIVYKGNLKIDTTKEYKLLASLKCYLTGLENIFIIKENLENDIDYLLFSPVINCYICIIICLDTYFRKYEKKINLCMSYINKEYKKPYHNPTIGLIIYNEDKCLKIAHYGPENTIVNPQKIYYVNL